MAEAERRTVPVGLRFKPSLKAEMDALAKADKRPLASYIEIVLEAHVAAKKTAGKRK